MVEVVVVLRFSGGVGRVVEPMSRDLAAAWPHLCSVGAL